VDAPHTWVAKQQQKKQQGIYNGHVNFELPSGKLTVRELENHHV